MTAPEPNGSRADAQQAGDVRRTFLGKELRSYGVMQRTLRDVAS